MGHRKISKYRYRTSTGITITNDARLKFIGKPETLEPSYLT